MEELHNILSCFEYKHCLSLCESILSWRNHHLQSQSQGKHVLCLPSGKPVGTGLEVNYLTSWVSNPNFSTVPFLSWPVWQGTRPSQGSLVWQLVHWVCLLWWVATQLEKTTGSRWPAQLSLWLACESHLEKRKLVRRLERKVLVLNNSNPHILQSAVPSKDLDIFRYWWENYTLLERAAFCSWQPTRFHMSTNSVGVHSKMSASQPGMENAEACSFQNGRLGNTHMREFPNLLQVCWPFSMLMS